jgi:hypothetical protein
MSTEIEQLLDLERRRCAAIAAGDTAALEDLLSDDYQHVHMTGEIEDRAGHLKTVAMRPRVPARGDVKVRLYGDFAVLTGPLTNTMASPDAPPRIVEAYCQQVAVRRGGAWRFVAVQLTAKPRERTADKGPPAPASTIEEVRRDR